MPATNKNDTPNLDAWTMSTSIMVALHKAVAKAHQEYQENFAAAEGKPFAPGVSSSLHLYEYLKDAQRSLEADLRKHARSNGLAVPKDDTK